MIRHLAFLVRLAAVAGIQALAWLRERWHRLDDNGPRTIADALGFVDSIRASEIAPELTVAPTFGPIDEPTQAFHWWELPVSPSAPTPIGDELEAEWRIRKVLNDSEWHVPTAWLMEVAR